MYNNLRIFTIEYTPLLGIHIYQFLMSPFLQVKIYIEHIHLNILRATFNLGRYSICNSTWYLADSYCPWNFRMHSSHLSLWNWLGYPKMSNKTIRIFYEVLGYALQSSTKEVKTSTIQDLQELTSLFVHYCKGDVLEDFPGLVDFTVKLNINDK